MLVDKPAGPTSHDVVVRVRRSLGTRAVGHAGTLDPFATGLLVLLVGRATRLARFVERQDKGYLAEAVFGATTETDDREGTVVARSVPEEWPDPESLRRILAEFQGTHLQRPPAFSARRVGGRRGYQLARRGEPVELTPTPVTIRVLELLRWEPPVLHFRAVVSAGTYLRAIARDLGERLGSGGYLRALRRESVGPLRVEQALAPEAVGPATPLLAPLDLVAHLPRVELQPAAAVAVRYGRPVEHDGAGGVAALVEAGRLVAVAEGVGGAWRPRVVVDPA